MIVQHLIAEINLHLRQSGQGEFTSEQILLFLNSAAWDFRDGGWLLRMEDNEAIEVVANTSEYAVPDGFAYIKEVWMERTVNGASEYTIPISDSHWTLRLNGDEPVIFFYTQTSLETGKKLKLVGQKRPTIYAGMSESVDPGMVARLRERAKFYALMAMAPGNSELSRVRYTSALAQRQLDRPYPPKAFRQLPSSKLVPGRE